MKGAAMMASDPVAPAKVGKRAPGKYKGEIDDNFKAPKGQSSYDMDPDNGERPYKSHEASDMAHHVVKAMGILQHPIKSAGVENHFKQHKQQAKTFEDLQQKIGQDMTA